MALVYKYDDVFKGAKKSLNANETAARKAVKKAGFDDETIEDFFAKVARKTNQIDQDIKDFRSAVIDKSKGAKALFKPINPIVAKVLMHVIIAPQLSFKAKNLDLSIHKKGKSLQLWLTLKGEDKRVLLQT